MCLENVEIASIQQYYVQITYGNILLYTPEYVLCIRNLCKSVLVHIGNFSVGFKRKDDNKISCFKISCLMLIKQDNI